MEDNRADVRGPVSESVDRTGPEDTGTEALGLDDVRKRLSGADGSVAEARRLKGDIEDVRRRLQGSDGSVEEARQLNLDTDTARLFEMFGEGFEPAWTIESSRELLKRYLKDEREDTPPPPLKPWEFRIGLSKFFVAPLSISVEENFKAGYLNNGAMRQSSPPAFNAGQSETRINLTLYFPSRESIFGSGPKIIDFDNADDEVIDSYLSTLQGLVVQFKHAPFLPVRNTYLNKVYGITGVALKNIQISSIENFPNCLAVNLSLYKFNHRVYLPMIQDFAQAIHWGRYRSYMGRCAYNYNKKRRPSAINDVTSQFYELPDTSSPGDIDPLVKTPGEILQDLGAYQVGNKVNTAPNRSDPNLFRFYYPFHSPAEIQLPDPADIRPDRSRYLDLGSSDRWYNFLNEIGLSASTYQAVEYTDMVKPSVDSDTGDIFFGSSRVIRQSDELLLLEFLELANILAEDMGDSNFEAYYNRRLSDSPYEAGSPQALELLEQTRVIWTYVAHRRFMEDTSIATALAYQDQKRRQLQIDEWAVPMWRLNLDYGVVKVQSATVTMGNVISRIQLQMEDEPVHQHLGGEGTRLDISMIISGRGAEEELLKLRTMFDSISGLARLEHAHGVLGFLGIRSVMSDLAGMSHAVPLSFDVQTIPNHPNSYTVQISLLDFDVFQRSRERLDSSQQALFAEQFGKANPFLRLKQIHHGINAYPDLPLEVRNEEGEIIGHADPDYYFRSFKTIDDDQILPKASEGGRVDNGYKQTNGVTYTVGVGEDGEPAIFDLRDNAEIDFYNGSAYVASGGVTDLDVNMNTSTKTPGTTPSASYNRPYVGDSLTGQSAAMLKDMQYRDKDGRMIRAFPTYTMWLIDEGGPGAGIRLYDNFYGLQSVTNVSLVRSEDIMADTLVLQISNLYNNLSINYSGALDEHGGVAPRLINEQANLGLRTLTGIGEYILDLDTIDLRPGARVHLRLGYGGSVNGLEPVFNGKITEVQQGEVLTIVVQSDAVELGSIVNSSDDNARSGKMDGSFTNQYMSEPRDLMIELLVQGSSVSKEIISHASQGKIFSEGKHGIRHFGMILYEPMSLEEKTLNDSKRAALQAELAKIEPEDTTIWSQLFDPYQNLPVLSDFLIGLATKPDYEIFKRNIYPGNGTGVGQYLGGDYGDLLLEEAVVRGTGVTPGGESLLVDPITGEETEGQMRVDEDLLEGGTEDGSSSVAGASAAALAAPFTLPMALYTGLATEGLSIGEAIDLQNNGTANLLDKFGITNSRDEDEDKDPNQEIAFRAQTYMRTVWDMFRLCAALVPDYIVAVRPFEDRSTIFYGKPHWMYTSGVLPISTGPGKRMPIVEPDEIQADLRRRIMDDWESFDALDKFRSFSSSLETDRGVGGVGGYNQVYVDGSFRYDGSTEAFLREFTKTTRGGVELPTSSGVLTLEMHLPTAEDLETDIAQHKQLPELPPSLQHPFYMDRAGGVRGGQVKPKSYDPSKSPRDQSILGENPSLGGELGALGRPLEPEEEQWYCNMRWVGASGTKSDWKRHWPGGRIAVYRNGRGVVCVPAEWGPHVDTGKDIGLSPDSYFALGAEVGQSVEIRVMPDDTPLGPITFDSDGSSVAEVEGTGNESVPEFYEELIKKNETVEDSYGDDFQRYALENGHKITEVPIPFDYTSYKEGSSNPEVRDDVGQEASALLGERTQDEADRIWEEFRIFFASEVKTVEAVFDAFDEVLSEDLPGSGYDEKLSVILGLDNGWQVEEGVGQSVFVNQDYSQIKDLLMRSAYGGVVERFMRAMWQDAVARGWVVLKADKVPLKLNPLRGPGSSGYPKLLDDGWIVWKKDRRIWTFDSIRQALVVFVKSMHLSEVVTRVDSEGNPIGEGLELVRVTPQLRAFIEQNNTPGLDSSTDVGQLIEGGASMLFKDVYDSVKGVTTGVVGLLELSMMQLGGVLSQASTAEANAAILNKFYDDSIYYKNGLNQETGEVENELMFLVDNPFTREYGEPVVEIREPFQRIHHINSFQHIVDNGIIESTTDVATVITAYSNGKSPVTIHFDKGASAENQIEKTVETGLFLPKEGVLGALGAIFNPFSQRGVAYGDKNVPSKALAKRVAAWHLKESLKDIYQGEITILGDASIRPYDLIYIHDNYSQIFGMIQVEQVVHTMDSMSGFVTRITPNAVVTINDPAKFYLMSYANSKLAGINFRNKFRNSTNYRSQFTSEDLNRAGERLLLSDIEKDHADDLQARAQFVGGTSAVISSLVPNAAAERMAHRNSSRGTAILNPLQWGGWVWMRDNLIDQHGAYIHYLQKRGRPMDAGLSYAQGTAVGSVPSLQFVYGGLRLGSVQTDEADGDGDPRINLGDIVPQLQWDEIAPSQQARELDVFIDAANARVRQLSGKGGDIVARINQEVDVVLAKVTRVTDGDTFDVSPIATFSGGEKRPISAGILPNNTIRVAGVQSPEDDFKSFEPGTIPAKTAGQIATAFTRQELANERLVALRIYGLRRTGVYGRTIAYVFYNYPSELEGNTEAQELYLLNAAGSSPLISWTSYTVDGKPHTLDQALIDAGLGDVFVSDLDDPSPGVVTGSDD